MTQHVFGTASGSFPLSWLDDNFNNVPTTAEIVITSGKVLSVDNTITLAGTDSSTLNIGAGGTLQNSAFIATGTSAYNLVQLDGSAKLPAVDGSNLTNLAHQVYPAGGIPVSNGASWDSSLTKPSGTIVGTTDTQTLTNKTISCAAGTATAGTAPIKLASGTLLAIPETGAMEFNGDSLYFTRTTGSNRKTIAYTDSNITGNAATATTAQSATTATTATIANALASQYIDWSATTGPTSISNKPSIDAITYKGAIACVGNPNYPAGNSGDVYKCSSAGKVGGASGTSVSVGDQIVCNTNNTPAGDQATVGAYWNIFANSVNLASPGPIGGNTPSTGAFTTINGLTETAQSVGFTIAGGTTSKTLTVPLDASVSGTNTGDNATNSQYSGLVTNATHTGDVTGATSLTIANKAVTLAKMDDMATASLIYRKTASAGVPEVNSLATLKADLGLTGTNSGDQTSVTGNAGTVTNATLTTALTVNTGAVTLKGNVANTSALTIGAGAVSVSGTNTGDQTNISGNSATVTGLSVTAGKTLSVSNSMTLTATEGSTLAIGAGGTLGSAAYLIAGSSSGNVVQLNGSAQLPAVNGSLLTGISTNPPASSVSQSVLKTSYGEVSTISDAELTLPGGEYGFYPQIKTSYPQLVDARIAGMVSLIPTSYTTNIYLSAPMEGTYFYAKQRYVTSSGEVYWIFILRDKSTKKVLATFSSSDHPCFGNGGDPVNIAHPFPQYDNTKEIVCITPSDTELAEMKARVISGKSLLQVINEDYEIDETSIGLWPSEEVTVGLPEGHDWQMGEAVNPIKMIIPKPTYIICKKLKAK